LSVSPIKLNLAAVLVLCGGQRRSAKTILIRPISQFIRGVITPAGSTDISCRV
jgi:hypothetical protein